MRAAVAAASHDPNAPERLESAAHAGHSAGKRCHFRCADTISGFGDQQHHGNRQRRLRNPSDASCLARLRDTFAAYFAVGYACMVRRFRGTRLAPQPSIDALLDRFRFSRDPRICVSNSRRAPLTFGVFRPTVLLPEDLPVGDAQFQLVLGTRAGAHPAEGLPAQAAFDGLLVPVLVESAGLDDGMACKPRYGACVMKRFCVRWGRIAKKAYALTLLDMAQRNPKSAPLCSGFAKSGAEERIRAILSFKRIPAWVGICVAILFVLTAKCLYNAGSKPKRHP